MRIFSSKSEKRRYYFRMRVSAYCVTGIFLLLMVGALYGVLNLSFLQIKNIEVSGVARLEDLRPKALSGWTAQILGLNNFLAWPGKIGGVTVEKRYGEGKLVLVGPVADRFAIWCSKSCFWVNRGGVVLEPAPDTEGGTIAKVNDDRGTLLGAGSSVLSEAQFAAVAGILQGIMDAPVIIQKYKFNGQLEELVAVPSKGAQLIFSVRFTPDSKLFASLQALIAGGQIQRSEYADFTVENRIYIK